MTEECKKCGSKNIDEGTIVVEGNLYRNNHYRWCQDCDYRWYQEVETSEVTCTK